MMGALVLVLGLAACETNEQAQREEALRYRSGPQPVAPTPPSTTTTPLPSDPIAGAPSSVWQSPAPPDATKLGDAQVAGVVVALNSTEIEEAELAGARATSSDVRSFAGGMSKAHRAMLDDGRRLFEKEKITPTDNAVSNGLRTKATTQLASLEGLKGTAFDGAYVDDQVQAHQGALALIDQMMPNVSDNKLRSALEDARKKVEEHLHHAQKVQRGLQLGSTNMQGAGTPATK
jgi:putative membrane protein